MITSLIADAFNLPLPNATQLKLNNERCIITGEEINIGYKVIDVISKTTNDFEMFFNHANSYMSIDAARCFQGSNPQAKPKPRMECSKSMAIVNGVSYEPLINDIAAIEQGRPYWSKLVRDLWENSKGSQCLFILSTDTKTRIWHQPHVRIGILGHATPITIYDPSQAINRTVSVDWVEMLNDLEICEQIISAGFWNKFLATSLFDYRKAEIPIPQIMEWETKLQKIRKKPHFQMIHLISRERKNIKWESEKQPLSPLKPQQLNLF